jgi:hypothetical protein
LDWSSWILLDGCVNSEAEELQRHAPSDTLHAVSVSKLGDCAAEEAPDAATQETIPFKSRRDFMGRT